jgi:hypothetical protein
VRRRLSAALRSHLQLVGLAHECGLDLGSGRFWQSYIAGEVADVTTLTVARELGLLLTLRLLCGAAESGCIAKLSWLYTQCAHDQIIEWQFSDKMCSSAAFSGSIQMMEWVVERGAVLTYTACDNAAKMGDLAMLNWLCQRRCPWYISSAIEFAAQGGHIEMLEHLRQHEDNGFDFASSAGRGAGRAGQVHV